MKVRMKTIMAGPAGNHGVGDIADFPQAQACHLIERGHAEQVGPDDPAPAAAGEAAVPGPVEAAMMPSVRPKAPRAPRRPAGGT